MSTSSKPERATFGQALRAAPATVPCVVALGLTGWWSMDRGGFAVGAWVPGGLVLLGLLVVAAVTAPNVWRAIPRTVVAATLCALGYGLWSFASIGWASDPGFALQGATRTLLYVLVFALFALWPQRGATAVGLLSFWVGLAGLAGLVLSLRLAGTADPTSLFGQDRLKAPTGYPNATAALLLMPVVAAVVLSASRRVAWWVRGPSAGIAVLLGSLALLTVSRGAVYSTPVVVLVLLIAIPGRVRHVYATLLVGVAITACAPRLLDVGEVISSGGDPAAALDRALTAVALVVLAVTFLGSAAAWLARHRPPSAGVATRISSAARVVVVLLTLAAIGGGAVIAGNPVNRVEAAWDSFKGGYGDNDPAKNRLVSGLGSNRYDFYRVALDTWTDNPLAGVGADNFYQQYLRAGTSTETPRYPHSFQLRTLAQTGAIGALLLAGFLGCALVAAARAMRADDPLGRVAASAATIAFVYWAVHGSVDWFWEWAGLGVPAFALLGLACALAPRRARAAGFDARPVTGRPLLMVGVVTMLAALPLVALGLADLEQRRAADTFATRPLAAYAHLQRAGDLDRFSSTPATLEGSIALRFGDLPRADAAFARALSRVPDDQYATLERGAIASAQGQRGAALRLLGRAVVLAPRDPLAREALQVVRDGDRIDVVQLNRRILADAQRLAG